MAGGLLTNTYRSQLNAEGNIATAGLFFVGDAVSTTDPITVRSHASLMPSLRPFVGPYLGMQAGPESLRVVEERVRELLRDGWRPPFADGPTRDQLVESIEELAPASVSNTIARP